MKDLLCMAFDSLNDLKSKAQGAGATARMIETIDDQLYVCAFIAGYQECESKQKDTKEPNSAEEDIRLF